MTNNRLGIVVALRLAKHISESELTHTVAVRDITVRSTDVGARLKDIVSCTESPLSKGYTIDFGTHGLSLFKHAEVALSKDKVPLVRVVLDGSAQHHGARLELHNVVALH